MADRTEKNHNLEDVVNEVKEDAEKQIDHPSAPLTPDKEKADSNKPVNCDD